MADSDYKENCGANNNTTEIHVANIMDFNNYHNPIFLLYL